MDPGIICFEHCRAQTFCFQLPEKCYICNTRLSDLHILPFRVPYPFVQAKEYPCSIVIRPTIGDFLNEYYQSKDLHIGLTTSSGLIVEFDKHGLRLHHSCEWNQCLLIKQIPCSWTQTWDTILYKMCRNRNWCKSAYNERHYNCYTFVLRFLDELNYYELSSLANNRVKFCEEFIVPKTRTAAKYISLYRKLKTNNCIIKTI